MALLDLVASEVRRDIKWQSIFSTEPPPIYSNTNMDLVRHELKVDNNIDFTIPNVGDLVGEIWYEVELENFGNSDIKNIIDKIKITIGGEVIESYNSKALNIISLFDKKAKFSIDKNNIVFPLRFCTSVDSHQYLPSISLAFHQVRVCIKLHETVKVKYHCLNVQYINLDSYERGEKARNKHLYSLTTKHTLTKEFKVKEEQEILCLLDSTCAGIKVSGFRKSPSKVAEILYKPLRDIIIDTNIDFEWIKISFSGHIEAKNGWHEYTTLSKTMVTKVIPRHFYDSNQCFHNNNIIFIPFDHTPIAIHPTHTLNAHRIFFKIEAKVKTPGEYKACFLFRSHEIFEISSGMLSRSKQ